MKSLSRKLQGRWCNLTRGGTSAVEEDEVGKESQTRPAVKDGSADKEVPK
jgi:hypothetical protein